MASTVARRAVLGDGDKTDHNWIARLRTFYAEFAPVRDLVAAIREFDCTALSGMDLPGRTVDQAGFDLLDTRQYTFARALWHSRQMRGI